MSEWKEYKLGEIAEIKGGKRLPKGELLVDYETPHPYIRVTDMGKKWIRKSGLQFVTPKVQKTISRYVVNSGDVILSIVGSIGLVGRISQELNGANLTENCVKLLTNKTIVNDDFLFYFLISDEGQYEIEKRNVGSTQPKLPLYNIKDIDIFLPPLPEQKAIASILSCLDDKIDLLHRQNATLEKMAETLFRQWFIEDAKEEWEIAKMESLISIGSGKGLKKESFIENGLYPILGANGEIGRTNEFIFDEKLIYTGRVGTLGNIFRIENEKVWLSDNTLVIKPLGFFNFIYFTLKNSHLEDYDVGSTQPLIRQSDIKEIEVVLPPIEILKEFESIANKVFQKIKSNQTQIRTLTALRDTLLPKLMSGEIRVL